MNSEAAPLRRGADDLRAAFDASFAKEASIDLTKPEKLLSIVAGDEAYLIRSQDVRSFFKTAYVTPLPRPRPCLAGIAAIRGAMVPVFSLSGLLGSDKHQGHEPWLAICGDAEPIGLAFSAFERVIHIRRDAAPVPGVTTPRRHIDEVIRIGEEHLPVLNVASIVASAMTVLKKVGDEREAQ